MEYADVIATRRHVTDNRSEVALLEVGRKADGVLHLNIFVRFVRLLNIVDILLFFCRIT